MPLNDDPSTGRVLATALAAMAGVSVLVGLAIGGVVVGVVDVAGLGEAKAESDGAPASLYLPDYQPTETPGASPSTAPDGSASATPSPTATKKPAVPPRERIRLTMAPQQVPAGGRIDVSGTYPAGDGAVLSIQRREGSSWVDFPVTATVTGGSFQTWIQTSRTGVSRFRVTDPAAGRASNVVRVTVG